MNIQRIMPGEYLLRIAVDFYRTIPQSNARALVALEKGRELVGYVDKYVPITEVLSQLKQLYKTKKSF